MKGRQEFLLLNFAGKQNHDYMKNMQLQMWLHVFYRRLFDSCIRTYILYW